MIRDNAYECEGFLAVFEWYEHCQSWDWITKIEIKDPFILPHSMAMKAPKTFAQAVPSGPGVRDGERRRILCVKNKQKRKSVPLTTESDMVVYRHLSERCDPQPHEASK